MGGGGFGDAVGKGSSDWVVRKVEVHHTGKIEISIDEHDSKDNRNLKDELKKRIAERERKFK